MVLFPGAGAGMRNKRVVDDPVCAPGLAARRSWRIKWRYASPIIFVHLVALLAFVPWFFSWTGVILLVLGVYVFGTLGINIGYHRLLTHRGFSCPRWLEHTFAILGACCAEESPIVWVGWHRQHHEVADQELDPHSPVTSFLWGHIGWLVIKNSNSEAGPLIRRYSTDLASDPLYAWLEDSDNWIKVALVPWGVYFVLGFGAVSLAGGATADAIQFGLSLVVWGAAARMVLAWHVAWSINSVTHLWGYRNYQTPDNSRNNTFIGLISNGEGWHNNHHADPRSAKHGHSWREPDVAWLSIRVLMMLGLARDVALPSPHRIAALKVDQPRS
jgi:fatty-acid desaturase